MERAVIGWLDGSSSAKKEGRSLAVFDKLTVSELRALAYEYYNHIIPQSGLLKPQVVELVVKLYSDKPLRLDQVVSAS